MKKLFAILPLLTLLSCNPQTRINVFVDKNTDYAGRGNRNEVLLNIEIGAEQACRLTAIDVRLSASAGDVERLTLVRDGKVVAKAKVKEGKENYQLNCFQKVQDTQEFQVCADIRPDAAEGGKVEADITRLRCGRTETRPIAVNTGAREIILCRKMLFAPGSYGSASWRIPALLQLSDGTLLAVNDRRNEDLNDLPGKIDVVYRLSTDRGRTWTEPQYLHKNSGFMDGCGDPALAELLDGTVICTFAGGETFSHSRLDNPQRSYFCISTDHGRTWTEKKDITSFIWGPDAENPECREYYHSNFISSGNSLVLKSGEHKGRFLCAGVLAGPDGRLSNRAIYTDDLQTWHVSGIACDSEGDEAKMVQLLDGSILMSIRTYGERFWTISTDGGQTWAPHQSWPDMNVTNCNGDLIRYSDSLLLHSIPYSMKRRDVSIMLSRDEGKTWPEHKIIFQGPSQYSSLTVLDDGTIGAYVEGPRDCELWYLNFSADWLQKPDAAQADTLTAEGLKGVQLWKDGPLWADRNLGTDPAAVASGYAAIVGKYIPKNGGEIERVCEGTGTGSASGTGTGSGTDSGDSPCASPAWELPTPDDFQALKDNCTWEWTCIDGICGYTITGELGSIFLPAVGYKSRNILLKHFNSLGHYWTTDGEYNFNECFKGDCSFRGLDNGLSVRLLAR